MRYPTHLVAGACATLGLGYVAQVPIGLPEIVAGAVAGLLPNVDYVLPALESSRSPFLRRLAGRAVIGGLTHAVAVALPAGALLGFLAALATGRAGMLVAGGAGVLSHLLLDLFGQTGVQLWAPFSRAWIAFPPWERLRPPRRGTVEESIFIGGLILLAGLGIQALFPYAVRLLQRLQGGG
jgi:membrane-bound metal-dependent hydrolase YbcI (DUF457 family)